MTTRSLSTLPLALACLLLGACSSETTPPTASVTPPSSSLPAEDEFYWEAGSPIPADLRIMAEEVIFALSQKDMLELARFASTGIRFTPSTHVDPEKDVVLYPQEMANGFNDETVRTWGTADGSGEPIEMTFSDYYDRYVWNKDFTSADDVRWDHVQDRGNTIDNAMEAYPSAHIMELHVAGTEEYGGMDWQSLRLVFKKNGNLWILTGIIHDEWTI